MGFSPVKSALQNVSYLGGLHWLVGWERESGGHGGSPFLKQQPEVVWWNHPLLGARYGEGKEKSLWGQFPLGSLTLSGLGTPKSSSSCSIHPLPTA